MTRKLIVTCFTVFVAAGFANGVLRSPDGNIEVQIDAPAGQLSYSVSFHGKPMIDRSALRLELQDQKPLGAAVTIASQTPGHGSDDYKLIAGKRSEVQDGYNSLTVDTSEEGSAGRKFTIEARAYNDGVAFRYVIPEQATMRDYRLTKEATEFRISTDAITYSLLLPNYRTSYEAEYLRLNASAFSGKAGLGQNNLVGLPVLMHLSDRGWLAIEEADLRGNAAMYLAGTGRGWGEHRFESRLSQGDEPEVLVRSALPHHSAWRLILMGDQPGRLMESTLLTSLNPRTEITDTSWIRPGLATWDWWSGNLDPQGRPSFTTENLKTYVDLASESHFPYMLVDAGWAKPHDITQMNGKVDIPALVQYATPKNVKIWIWMHHDDVVRQMDQAFALYEKWGVAGLKVDFIERDDQTGVDFTIVSQQPRRPII